MLKRVLGWLALSAIFATAPIEAAGRWWAGGGIGLAFGGNVDYVSVEPVVGYWVTERVPVGARLIWRYRNDKRFDDDLSTTDYGGALFARYLVTKNVFVHGEYEYLTYEIPELGGSAGRESFGSLLAGAGFHQSLGPNAFVYVLGLYNLSYDEGELSPYDEPWVLRAGVGFRF